MIVRVILEVHSTPIFHLFEDAVNDSQGDARNA